MCVAPRPKRSKARAQAHSEKPPTNAAYAHDAAAGVGCAIHPIEADVSAEAKDAAPPRGKLRRKQPAPLAGGKASANEGNVKSGHAAPPALEVQPPSPQRGEHEHPQPNSDHQPADEPIQTSHPQQPAVSVKGPK